jgi:hypothetical protein
MLAALHHHLQSFGLDAASRTVVEQRLKPIT